jgi:AcrR family transcriptional regulator
MATRPRQIDRRVMRTRQLLQDAYREVSQEKSFSAISIQDITDRANVNRGTFYAHFTDKYALIDSIIREEFHQLLVSKLPSVEAWDRTTLHLLIQTVLDYIVRMRRQCHLTASSDPWFQRATHEELTALLLKWLTHAGHDDQEPSRVPLETAAQVASWAIFGAAAQWSHDPSAISLEQMANDVLTVIMDGMSRFVPDVGLACVPSAVAS